MIDSIRRNIAFLVFPVALLLLWELAVRTGFFPNTLIASPSEVVFGFYDRIMDLTLLKHTAVSLRRVAIGFALGTFLGILSGVIVGSSRLASKIFEPTLLSLIPIPGIAWIPVLIIIFGIGEASKILLIAISGFCTLFIPTAYSIRSANKNLVELAQVYGKSRMSTLRHILFPSAIPNIIAAMRVTLIASWTLLISAEVIASSEGLGWLIWDARRFSRPEDMIVGMITFGIIGKSADYILVMIEKYLTRYKETYRDMAYD